jgi:hypothetical protein
MNNKAIKANRMDFFIQTSFLSEVARNDLSRSPLDVSFSFVTGPYLQRVLSDAQIICTFRANRRSSFALGLIFPLLGRETSDGQHDGM